MKTSEIWLIVSWKRKIMRHAYRRYSRLLIQGQYIAPSNNITIMHIPSSHKNSLAFLRLRSPCPFLPHKQREVEQKKARKVEGDRWTVTKLSMSSNKHPFPFFLPLLSSSSCAQENLFANAHVAQTPVGNGNRGIVRKSRMPCRCVCTAKKNP